MHAETLAVFLAELFALLLVGRAAGEVMVRLGQPAIFGQLIGGILLGPSVLGLMAPASQKMLFPGSVELKSMLDAFSQIGILLLLLFTGMETNVAILARRKSAVIATSVCGIAIPLALGVAITYAIPQALAPDAALRLSTSLFIGIALSISSVKIVAMVLLEIGALRRDVGQLILATAISDDIIAWVLIAIVAGIASQGTVDVTSLSFKLGATALFFFFCFRFGGRIVAAIIRWTNDNLRIEAPTLTPVLLIMLLLGMTTELIGIHAAPGAFAAGVLVGQSPILTERIEAGLRGLIVAFFSPIFFASAGLGMDVRVLADTRILAVTLLLAAVATAGKFGGAFLGGRIGGLSWRESIALGSGLNARGSTEVIVATIGLSLGVLSHQVFTMIVAIAVLTTLAMPVMLRWAIARVPVREEEAARLDKEEAEASAAVPHMERVLLYADTSGNGKRAARLAAWFASSQRSLVTVAAEPAAGDVPADVLKASLKLPVPEAEAAPEAGGEQSLPAEGLILKKPVATAEDLMAEAGKAYDIAFVGIERAILGGYHGFVPEVSSLISGMAGPVAIALSEAPEPEEPGKGLRVLVPASGSALSRVATELAIAMVKSAGGEVTVLHNFERHEPASVLSAGARRLGATILGDARRMGKRNGVAVKVVTGSSAQPLTAVRRAIAEQEYDLVIVGASLRFGDRKFVSANSVRLLRAVKLPLLLIVQ